MRECTGTHDGVKSYFFSKEDQVVLLKRYYDENHIFSIEAILRHKQVACMRRKMLFTIFKYLFLFQRYSSLHWQDQQTNAGQN